MRVTAAWLPRCLTKLMPKSTGSKERRLVLFFALREGRPVMIKLRHSHFGCYSLQACSRFLLLSPDSVKTIPMKGFQERIHI